MKIFIASDIHGSEYYCKKMLERFEMDKYEKIVLLGDILYHGPRNDLPKDYNPKAVMSMLNAVSNKIICVRGNCDTEVDQMVLDFPIMADYTYLILENKTMLLTHGHKAIGKGNADVIISGHTHIPRWEAEGGVLKLNPGSVSIPKENSLHSYMTFDGKAFRWCDVESGAEYNIFNI